MVKDSIKLASAFIKYVMYIDRTKGKKILFPIYNRYMAIEIMPIHEAKMVMLI